jgi:hypothetical protein
MLKAWCSRVAEGRDATSQMGLGCSRSHALERSMWGTTFRREYPFPPEQRRNMAKSPYPTMNIEFKDTFIRLGLEQYLPIFAQSGFDNWHLLCNITESDLALLGVKRGHRRKLQREIARRHSWPDYEPLPAGGMVCHEFMILPSQSRDTIKWLMFSKL